MRRLVGTSGLLVMVLATSGAVLGQTSDAMLRDRVRQLVEKLDAPKMEARQAAEDGLIKLGPPILPLLPESPRSASTERKQRLERIRDALRDAGRFAGQPRRIEGHDRGQGHPAHRGPSSSSRSSRPTSSPTSASRRGPRRPTRRSTWRSATSPSSRRSTRSRARRRSSPNSFTGDGSIGLMAGKLPENPLVKYTGPFRVAFTQIAVVRDLQAGSASASVQFAVAWEPRLRPHAPAAQDRRAEDPRRPGQVGRAAGHEGVERGRAPARQPGRRGESHPDAPDRSAKSLATIKVRADITVPAGLRTFRFPTLDVKDAVVQKQGDIAVTLEGTEVDEQVWKVDVALEYPGEGPAFESYRQGLFNNRLWLQKPDGSRFEHNGGFSNTVE